MIDDSMRLVAYQNAQAHTWQVVEPSDYDDAWYDPESYPDYPWYGYTFQVSRFTNRGRLSMSEVHILEARLGEQGARIVRKLAEDTHAKHMALHSDKDVARAIQLADIVSKADFEVPDSELAVIKVKTSHSKWYRDSFSEPSTYLTLVPVSVASEAMELQSIRRKHQDDPTFDFSKSIYRTIEVRVADHDNGSCAYIDSISFDWRTLYRTDWIDRPEMSFKNS